jgi:hypothetical protein
VEPQKPCHECPPRAATDNLADNLTENLAANDEVLTLASSARRLEMPVSIVARWARRGLLRTANAQGPLTFRPADLDAASLKDSAESPGPTETPGSSDRPSAA